MSINESKIRVGLSCKLFEDAILAYFKKEKLNHFSFNKSIQLFKSSSDYPLNVLIDVTLIDPSFRLKTKANTSKYFALTISGFASIYVETENTKSDSLYKIPFSIELELDFILKPQPQNAAPKIALVLREVHNNISPFSDEEIDNILNYGSPFSDEEVDEMLNTINIFELINSIEVDAITPLVTALDETAVGISGIDGSSINETKYDQYPVRIVPLNGIYGMVDGVGIFVGRPGDNLVGVSVGSDQRSFIPPSSEISLICTRQFLKEVQDTVKSELISVITNSTNIISLENFELRTDMDRIIIQAKAKEVEYSDSTVDLALSIFLSITPGSDLIRLKAQAGVDVELNGIANLLNIFDFEGKVEEELPDIGQQLIERMSNQIFSHLSDSINFESVTFEGIDLHIYPNEIELQENEIRFHIQVISHHNKERLFNASHSRTLNRFMLFQMRSGRKYQTKDLAQFMKNGLISVDGYHDVDGEYIRANPDDSLANNLLERFERS